MTTYRDLEAAHQRTDRLETELAQLRARNEQLARDRERPLPVVQRSWLLRTMEWLDPLPRRDATRTVVTMILAVLFIAAKESSYPGLAAVPLIAIAAAPRVIAHYRKERRP